MVIIVAFLKICIIVFAVLCCICTLQKLLWLLELVVCCRCSIAIALATWHSSSLSMHAEFWSCLRLSVDIAMASAISKVHVNCIFQIREFIDIAFISWWSDLWSLFVGHRYHYISHVTCENILWLLLQIVVVFAGNSTTLGGIFCIFFCQWQEYSTVALSNRAEQAQFTFLQCRDRSSKSWEVFGIRSWRVVLEAQSYLFGGKNLVNVVKSGRKWVHVRTMVVVIEIYD